MCGIAGIISTNPQRPVTRAALRAMAGRIAHRGPDGEGIWLNHEDAPSPERPQVGFAFRRLAVLDCDARAMQPMTTPDGRCTIVFNGEVYNFHDLRNQLPGIAWRTTGDTEVLLHALATWGADALPKLNGMFAIALWDAARRSLLLARDRMGQKPLYFSHNDGVLAFASEVGALRASGIVSNRISMAALDEYLRFGCIGAPRSMFHDVAQLEPASLMAIESFDTLPAPVRYFDPNTPDPASPVRFDRTLVERAVERQLVADVPLGVFLSGGIDSSVVALCARRHGAVQTFSIGFDDPRYDESGYAREVARHLGTDHHEFRVTPDAVHDLPELARVFGEPFGDSSALPTHYLARETRKHVTVALSGDGGDELFGGYDRYRAIALPVAALRPLAGLGARLAQGHPKSPVTRIGRLLASAGQDEATRYAGYLRLFDEDLLAALRPDASAGEPVFVQLWQSLRSTRDPAAAAAAIDRVTYLPSDLLTKVDRCSMLHSLEVRSPFMDHELVHAVARLTCDELLGSGKKRMLREAFAADLPDFVFKRRKMGFAVPIGDWFRSSLRPMLGDHLFASDSFAREQFVMPVVERMVDEHISQRRDHSQRLYALLMLELWWRQIERV